MLRDETGLDPWKVSPKEMKRKLAKAHGQVPDVDKWRLPNLSKLLEQRQMDYYSGFCKGRRKTELIDSVCVN